MAKTVGAEKIEGDSAARRLLHQVLLAFAAVYILRIIPGPAFPPAGLREIGRFRPVYTPVKASHNGENGVGATYGPHAGMRASGQPLFLA